MVGGNSFAVREITPTNFVPTSSSVLAATAFNTATTGINLGNFPTIFNGTAGNDTYTLSLNAAQTMIQINGGTTNFQVNKSLISTLTFNGTAGDDTFTIDASNGSPVPVGGITFNGGGNVTAAGDTLALIGSSGAESATFNATHCHVWQHH